MKKPAKTTTPNSTLRGGLSSRSSDLLRNFADLIDDGKVASLVVSIETQGDYRILVSGQDSGIAMGLFLLNDNFKEKLKGAL
jgi:hypothetical protein